jgi:ribosomal protein L32
METTLANGFTFDQEVELCQIYWPTEYAAARTSKRRRNLRKAAAHKCLTDFNLKRGLTCGNCTHRRGKICELDSDFYGDVTIKLEDTCPTHSKSS